MKDTATLTTFTDLFSAGHIIVALLVFITGWLLVKITQSIVAMLATRFVRHRLQITRMFPIFRVLIWSVVVYLIVVKVFEPPQNTLLAMLASMGLALGLAAQDILRNILSGILILFEQPFRIGDMVKIEENYGEILSIDLRSVRMRTFDDNIITIPNATVMSQSVSNANGGALDEMVVVEFTLPATVDAQRVKALALEATSSSPYVYLKKPINVIIEDVFDRTFLTRFKVKAYVLDTRLERVFASDVLERIKKVLIDEKLLTEEIVLGQLIQAA